MQSKFPANNAGCKNIVLSHLSDDEDNEHAYQPTNSRAIERGKS